jgi:hypothetical protein
VEHGRRARYSPAVCGKKIRPPIPPQAELACEYTLDLLRNLKNLVKTIQKW